MLDMRFIPLSGLRITGHNLGIDLMRAIRQIIPFFLVLSLTVTGIPFLSPNDANRDRKVDLQDAVILVKSVVGTAAEPGPFNIQVTNAVTALQTVAELTTIITVDDSRASSIHSASLVAYLPSDSIAIMSFPDGERVDSPDYPFTSITPVPIPHPPRV